MKKPPWGGWSVVLGLWSRLCCCQSVEGIKRAIANGVLYAETGPELENNNNVQTQWKSFRTEQHKRRRCYIRSLD